MKTAVLPGEKWRRLGLRQRVLHRGGLVAHTGWHVAVGIECYRYGGVPEKLLDELGMNGEADG